MSDYMDDYYKRKYREKLTTLDKNQKTLIEAFRGPTKTTLLTDSCGRTHCDTGPAMVLPGLSEEWYRRGRRHRIGGPAVTVFPGNHMSVRGQWQWWKNGYRHRDDGPAIVYADGGEAYYIDGARYTKTNYYKRMLKKANKTNML